MRLPEFPLAVAPPAVVSLLLAVALTWGPRARDSPAVCIPAPYRPPVAAAVAVPFALPNGPFGAGNRGLEYRTTPGEPVRAIGAGVVRFAGSVAGERFVTIEHADGLLSSYSYLARSTVRVGRFVVAGSVIGTASSRFQLGLRRGGDYIDPAPLLGPALRPRLVGASIGPPSTVCAPR